MKSNYELQCEQWAARMLTLDPHTLCQRLPELQYHKHELQLRHFGRRIALNLEDGSLNCLSDDKPLSINLRLNIYTLLWYVKENASLCGEWVAFRSLKNASPFAPAFQKSILDVFATTFTGHEEEITQAVEKLGGFQIDAHGYFLPAFACIPMRLQFWEGDEDFPAQANLLFDRNATDFIHVESIVTIASEGLCRLAEAANLPLGGKTF